MSRDEEARVIALLDRVGLGQQFHKRPDTMSGGPTVCDYSMVTHNDRLAQEADCILMIEDGWVHEVDKREHRMKLLNSLKES